MKMPIGILVLTFSLCNCLSQTNDLAPEMNRKLQDFKSHIEFMRTNEQPIHTVLSFEDGQTSCQIFFRGHTNVLAYVPIPQQEFDAHLFSADGKEIAKTADCNFGQKLEPDKLLLAGDFYYVENNLRNYPRQLDFKDGNTSHYWKLNVLQSFQIKTAGEYRLQVDVRLFTKDTNGVFRPFLLPPAETKVKVSQANISGRGN